MHLGTAVMGAHDEPYVGLRAFDSGDRDRFYGRDRESRDVSALWRSNQLLILSGPSGVGKTSLIQAGVIPRVDRATADVLLVGRVSDSPTSVPSEPHLHNPFHFALLSSWSPHDLPADLVDLSIADFLGRRRVRTNRHGQPLPVLAAIDQFEELFSGSPHQQPYLDQFIDQLATALEAMPSLRLLISIREDAVGDLVPLERRLIRDSQACFRLLPLTPEAALEAVTRPLDGTGRSFAPVVAEKLVDDLRTSEITDMTAMAESVDPMHLQLVCAALWRSLPTDVTTITDDHRNEPGDADHVLTKFYTETLAKVARDHRVPHRKLAGWLWRNFVNRRGSRGIVYEGLSDTAGMPNSVVCALADRHILRSEVRADSRWYQLQHDRLIEPARRAEPRRDEQTGRQANSADYLRIAEGALASGDLRRAREHAEEALRGQNDDDPWILAEVEAFLGNLARLGGQHGEAVHHYRQAAERFEALGNKSAVGHTLAAIGRLLLAQGPYADAIDALQAAVIRLPDDVAVQLELARALWFSGDLGAAAAVAGGVLANSPDAADALAGRGEILVERDNPLAALEDLDHLLRRHPGVGQRAEVRAARALALAQIGQLDEALVEADAAVADAPDSGPVLLRASGVVRATGQRARADDLLREARDARVPKLFPHQLAEVHALLAESRQEADS